MKKSKDIIFYDYDDPEEFRNISKKFYEKHVKLAGYSTLVDICKKYKKIKLIKSYRSYSNRKNFFQYLKKIENSDVFRICIYNLLYDLDKYFFKYIFLKKYKKKKKLNFFLKIENINDLLFYLFLKKRFNNSNIKIIVFKINSMRVLTSYIYRKFFFLIIFVKYLTYNFSKIKKEKTKIIFLEFLEKSGINLKKLLNTYYITGFKCFLFNSNALYNFLKNNKSNKKKVFSNKKIINFFELKNYVKEFLFYKFDLGKSKLKQNLFDRFIYKQIEFKLPLIAHYSNNFQKIINLYNPKILVTSTYSSIFGRTMALKAKKNYLKSAYYQHGVIPGYDFLYDFLNDEAFVWGKYEKKYITRNNNNIDVKIVGQFLNTSKLETTKSKKKIKKYYQITYFLNRTDGASSSFDENVMNIKKILQNLKYIKSKFKFFIKPHPADDHYKIKKYKKIFNFLNFVNNKESSENIILQSDLVILQSSSIIFDAILNKKSILVVNFSLNEDTLNIKSLKKIFYADTENKLENFFKKEDKSIFIKKNYSKILNERLNNGIINKKSFESHLNR